MAADTELQRHKQDYDGFIRLTTWIIGGIVLGLVLMAIFLIKSH